MNELQRQVYLSALGVDTYMPRWHLPFAPTAIACELPAIQAADDVGAIVAAPVQMFATEQRSQSLQSIQLGTQATSINSLISDIFESKKISKVESRVKTPANTFTPTADIAIDAFSLSVWRPVDGVMIVDSRNTQLALPTDTLLKNIVRHIFPEASPHFKEEVLRCPMIENSFAKRTANDARIELQTWLSVQCEIKPIKYLWLLGKNASNYLIADIEGEHSNLWQVTKLADASVQALILPSLNDLLINPALKKSLFNALCHYHC